MSHVCVLQNILLGSSPAYLYKSILYLNIFEYVFIFIYSVHLCELFIYLTMRTRLNYLFTIDQNFSLGYFGFSILYSKFTYTSICMSKSLMHLVLLSGLWNVGSRMLVSLLMLKLDLCWTKQIMWSRCFQKMVILLISETIFDTF